MDEGYESDGENLFGVLHEAIICDEGVAADDSCVVCEEIEDNWTKTFKRHTTNFCLLENPFMFAVPYFRNNSHYSKCLLNCRNYQRLTCFMSHFPKPISQDELNFWCIFCNDLRLIHQIPGNWNPLRLITQQINISYKVTPDGNQYLDLSQLHMQVHQYLEILG